MDLSADAILLGLGLMEQGGLSAARIAALLRAVAVGSVPDQLVALEERVLAESPDLAAAVTRLGAESYYVPVDCPSCHARFRAPGGEMGPDSYCPLCGEAIVTGRRFLFLEDYAAAGLRAAEEEAPFAAPPSIRRFAHFELVRLVGKGGAGRVYEARNLRSGRTVALKVLDFRPLESSAEAFKRLRREAQVAASVVHDHIVPVYDLGVAEGLPFIEMELVSGTTLREHVRREGALPAGRACLLCMQALHGLARVHQEKIIHGDIKPGNILIDEEGRARLTDFGLSRFLEETTTITASRKAVGSPHFMAPEQWRGESLSIPTDLYAVGLVLYYALTGMLPYEGASTVALMYKHLHEPLLEAGQVQILLPQYLGEVIQRATEKAPGRRFESAEEFADALSAFLDGSVVQQ